MNLLKNLILLYSRLTKPKQLIQQTKKTNKLRKQTNKQRKQTNHQEIMILPNVHKFVFDEERSLNFRNLVNQCAGSNNVIFSPHFGTIFSWWTPKTSPNSDEGGWSKLKNIQVSEGNMTNVSLWDSTQATSDIREMVDRHYECYLVPMKDVYYSAIMGDGVNFKVFVEHDNTFYSTNVTDKPDNFMVKSVARRTDVTHSTFVGTLYRLDNNMLEYHYEGVLDAWTTVDNEMESSMDAEMDTTPEYNLWSHPNSIIHQDYSMDSWNDLPSGVRLDLPLEPESTKTPLDDVQEYSSDDGDDELTSGSDEESDEDVANIVEGIPVDKPETDDEDSSVEETSDEDYEPSLDSDDSDDSYNDFHDEYAEYDEMRQDLNGCWYTRRQFYDYYGSDEAWDNLDPNIYHRMRYDENCDQWHTKEEMFQWYGTNVVWKKMNPKMQLKRRRLCDAYSWASYLPQKLQHSFIGDYMKTYKM